MNKAIKSIRGMHDYLPEELPIWNYIERIIKEVLTSYCYLEIRLPLLEKTEIFQRAIGNMTDVVEKEMYSFQDKSGNSLTLRPEGTVGCARAVIQNNLLQKKKQRFWYLGPMFRYERPQKGRYRQFYQFGAEAFGLDTEDIDLEMLMLTHRIWKRLGLEKNIRLEINSIGSQNDRLNYKKALVLFLQKYEYLLDKDCQRRLHTNPLRILDSKNIDIQKILHKAPSLNAYLNTHSQNHFQKLCNMLSVHGIQYVHNKNLVRGLDYYNSTVFEWKSDILGSQDTICAGGRYNYLLQELSFNPTSGIGFAIGMERLVFLARSIKIHFPVQKQVDIYIIVIGNNNKCHAISLSEEIKNFYPVLKIFINISDSHISKKIKSAVESASRIAIFIGDNEIDTGFFLIKDLQKKKQYFLIKKELLKKIKCFFKQDINHSLI